MPPDTPKYRARRRSVSAVTARRPWMISLMRRGGTPMTRANAFCVMPIGFMNSSARISPGWGLCSSPAFAGRLAVVVDDFDISWSSGGPDEANPPLIVDSNTVLAGSISFQGLEAISRWHPKVVHIKRRVEQAQLAQRHVLDIRRQPPAPLAIPDARRLCISEAQDHLAITYNVMGSISRALHTASTEQHDRRQQR